jgi:hypothetical protein
MDNPIIFQILLALVALFFIFLTYMNTKTWRWLHVTVTFFVFVAVIPFGVYAALTLKTREAWIKKHDQLEADLAKTREAVELANRGPISDVQQQTESVASLKGQLARTILDRGRVWRDGITGQAGPNGIVLNMAGAPQVDATGQPVPAATPSKHNIAEKTVLFAFAQGENPAYAGVPVPAAYLGEFAVTAVAETAITVVPTMPLAGDQAQLVGNPATQWILYEVMPVDGDIWLPSDEQQLRMLLPQAATGLNDAQYARFLAQFVRNGKAADEVNDPPDNIWIKVKFTKPHQVEVDAPLAMEWNDLPFDSQGRAMWHRLRRAGSAAEPGKADFAAGDVAVFDRQTGEKLIADGVATLEERIFRRTLADFDTKFRLAYLRYVELNNRIGALALDIQAVQASKDKADAQAALVEDYKSKLTDDLAKVTFERDEVTKYRQALESRVGEVRTELSQLYVSNRKLAAELASLNTEMTEMINRRTREATALNQ